MDPKTRKGRIIELFNKNEIERKDVAKHLGVTIRGLRYHLNKPVLNSMKLIRAIHEASGGKISMHWMITGEGQKDVKPLKYSIKSKSSSTIRQRVKRVLEECGIDILNYSNAVGRGRSEVKLSLNLNDEDFPLYNVISVHLLTGASIDYLMNGLEPVYLAKSTRNVSLVDFIEFGV